jgi:hypothetical protein
MRVSAECLTCRNPASLICALQPLDRIRRVPKAFQLQIGDLLELLLVADLEQLH